MIDVEISNRIRAVSESDWNDIIKKCYSHVQLTIGAKTKFGAHCEQRLGIPAHDYYVGNAIKAIYEQSWEWQFEKYDLCEQLVRVINSMISNEVRKYKSEKSRDKQLPLLVETSEFDLLIDDDEDMASTIEYEKKCAQALTDACRDNAKYQQFISLKKEGNSYDEIAEKLGCSKADAYRLMENISKKANRYLKSYN